VRELENVVERAIIISQGQYLDLGDWLPKHGIPSPDLPFLTIEESEREHISKVLQSVNWKVRGERGAANILGIKPTTLEARMKKLGIERKA